MLQRAIAAALLSDTPVKIVNTTYCSDSRAALHVVETLGAEVRIQKDSIYIHSGGVLKPTGNILNCGESGLGIRMFSPIAALWHEPLILTGEGSLLHRPVGMLEEPLKKLGAHVSTHSGLPPITVKGPLKGGEATVDGSISSQFLTGLLMALPRAAGDSRLHVQNLKSTPYIDMTISLLKHFGAEIQNTDYKIFDIKSRQSFRSPLYEVEGDWSGAAFLLVAGAIAGSVSVTRLDTQSPQADRKIIEALVACGADVKISPTMVEVSRKELNAFHFDATHSPDLFPPLVALAVHCNGTTVIEGVERLVHKESDRSNALKEEFTNLGGIVRIDGNRMEIDGPQLTGGTLHSRNDHRIAMAGATTALCAQKDINILQYECIAKSYPHFFDDLQAIGGVVYE